MKNWKNLLKVIPLVFFIFMGNFYYEVEGKSRSSRSKSSSISSSKSSSRKSSISSSNSSKSSSSKSSSSSSSSSKSSSSKSSSSSSSSSKSSSSKSSSSSSSSSKSSSSKSSSSSSNSSKSSSSKSSSSSSNSSKSSLSKSSSSSNRTSDTSSERSSLDVNNDKSYTPKESRNIKTQTIDGKKIESDDLEEVFEGGGIDVYKTKKYYYPISQRNSILNSSFIEYYIVYNAIDSSINMVTNKSEYSENQIIGAVYNNNGKKEIVMFEEGKTRTKYINMTSIITIIITIIVLWIFIAYKRTFSKR